MNDAEFRLAQSQAKCLPNMKTLYLIDLYVVRDSCQFPSKLKILRKILPSQISDEEKARCRLAIYIILGMAQKYNT